MAGLVQAVLDGAVRAIANSPAVGPEEGLLFLGRRHVLFEAERLAQWDGNVPLHAVAENEATVQHADPGIAKRRVFAIEVTKRGGQADGDRVHPGNYGSACGVGFASGNAVPICMCDSATGGTGWVFTYNQWLCRNSGSSSGLHSK